MQSRPLTLMGSGARSRRSFAAMMHTVRYGRLRGVVGKTFDLAEAATAHEVMAGREIVIGPRVERKIPGADREAYVLTLPEGGRKNPEAVVIHPPQ
jgi:hypothetical protein